MSPASSNRAIALDWIRAISAWVVMSGHLRAALLPDFDQLIAPHPLWKLFYLVTGMGHQAVVVFFVLSGYFVGGAVVRAGAQFDWTSYAAARLSRLWVVLVPALLLTACSDTLLLRLNPDVGDADHIASWHSIPAHGHFDLSLSTALQNLFFLQTVTAPTFGSNGPLWSLANEAWYYVLFPTLWCACRSTQAPWRRLAWLAFGAGLIAVMPTSMRWLFLVWLMGVAAHSLTAWDSVLRSRWLGAFAAMCGLACLVAARMGRLPTPHETSPDLIVGLCFALWCAHLRTRHQLATLSWHSAFAIRLSDMSYSLYLVHMPLVFLVVGYLVPHGKVPASVTGLSVYLLIFMLLTLFAWGFWWVFERHSPFIRQRILALTKAQTFTHPSAP